MLYNSQYSAPPFRDDDCDDNDESYSNRAGWWLVDLVWVRVRGEVRPEGWGWVGLGGGGEGWGGMDGARGGQLIGHLSGQAN